jgi:hypothetical protein
MSSEEHPEGLSLPTRPDGGGRPLIGVTMSAFEASSVAAVAKLDSRS